MVENLIQVLKSVFNEQAVNAVGQKIGLDASKTKEGIGAIIPAILAGILGGSKKDTAQPSWWKNISKFVTDDDGSKLNLGLLENTEFQGTGKGLVNSLFGEKIDKVIGSVAGTSGLDKSKAGNLLTVVAPMVIGYITSWLKKKGMSFADLIKNLGEYKSDLLKALPTGIGAGLFGLSDDRLKKEATKKAGSNLNWLYWIIGILVVLLILWLLFGKGCDGTDKKVVAPDTTTKVKDAVVDVKDAVKGKLNEAGEWVYDLGANLKRKLADGVELEIGENSVENRLINFIEDKNLPVDKATWFSMDRLYFESGKSTLKPESQDQLKRIVAIMKAYPDVKLKIGGYTDNTGTEEANLKISDLRAKSAMAELVKLGIDKNRLEAEGYGPKHPICPENDTPDCKAQNRRIDVRVTAK